MAIIPRGPIWTWSGRELRAAGYEGLLKSNDGTPGKFDWDNATPEERKAHLSAASSSVNKPGSVSGWNNAPWQIAQWCVHTFGQKVTEFQVPPPPVYPAAPVFEWSASELVAAGFPKELLNTKEWAKFSPEYCKNSGPCVSNRYWGKYHAKDGIASWTGMPHRLAAWYFEQFGTLPHIDPLAHLGSRGTIVYPLTQPIPAGVGNSFPTPTLYPDAPVWEWTREQLEAAGFRGNGVTDWAEWKMLSFSERRDTAPTFPNEAWAGQHELGTPNAEVPYGDWVGAPWQVSAWYYQQFGTLPYHNPLAHFGKEIGSMPAAKKAKKAPKPAPKSKKSPLIPPNVSDDGTRFVFEAPRYQIGSTYLRTQKAAGVLHLRDWTVLAGAANMTRKPLDTVRVWPHAEPAFSEAAFAAGIFGRPCPPRPRHGFVESRQVHSMAEVYALIAETVREEPLGEVMFLPRFSGAWSGIATNAGVTFGLGNDGATAGKNAVTVPSLVSAEAWKSVVGMCSVPAPGVENSPYLEFVEHNGEIVPVQLRDGPEQPAGLDWVPRDMTVRHVLKYHNNSMLEWEKLVANAREDFGDGLVVYAPEAGLASHIAVHAICNGVACITDPFNKPKVGTPLLATGNGAAPDFAPEQLAVLARFLTREFSAPIAAPKSKESAQKPFLRPAVAILQAAPRWADPRWFNLTAYGLATLTRFLAAACAGEARHYKRFGKNGARYRFPDGHCTDPRCASCNRRYGRPTKTHSRVSLASRADFKRMCGSSDRHKVYSNALNWSLPTCISRLEKCARIFADYGAWSSSYGGPKWEECATGALALARAVRVFQQEPRTDLLLAAISAGNTAINIAHNGGKILNKWISVDVLTAISHAPQAGLICPLVAHGALDPSLSPLRGDPVNPIKPEISDEEPF